MIDKLNIIPSSINYNSIYNKLLNSIYVSKNLTNIFKINNILDTTKIKINTNLPLVSTVLTKGNNKLFELLFLGFVRLCIIIH